MKFLIFGAGAIGTYIGGSLALADQPVTFIVRPARAMTLKVSGLRLREKNTERVTRNFTAYASLAEALAAGQYECLVFALKSVDTAAALKELRSVTATPPPILCLQNGVDNEPDIARLFGAERVIAGTVTTAIGKLSEGEIVVERKRGLGLAGALPLSQELVTTLNKATLNARLYPDARSMKWSKMLTNLVGNASSAILDLPVAEIFAEPRLFKIEIAMLRECLAVMRALKLRVVDVPGTPVRLLAFAAERLPLSIAQPLLGGGVSGGRGGKMPSFHIDLHSGKGRTEVRWLNGAVMRYGKEVGVPTPVNQVLTDTLEGLSEGRFKLEVFRRKPEALLRLIKP